MNINAPGCYVANHGPNVTIANGGTYTYESETVAIKTIAIPIAK